MRPRWMKLAEQKVNADVRAGKYHREQAATNVESFGHWRAYSTGQWLPVVQVPTTHKRRPKIEQVTYAPLPA